MEGNKFYRVAVSLWNVKLPPCLEYGYETERDFRHALWQLVYRWRGRTGECVGERNGLHLLRFHDTPGGRPDEAWLPACLLEGVPPPVRDDRPRDEADEELDRAFGFE